MMPIVLHPDERLRESSAPFGDVDEATRSLAEEMIETMHVGKGIGLAGVQVGVFKRIFVVHIANDTPRVFINPEIVLSSPEEAVYEEGCLSIPGVYADVRRSAQVQIQALNERGKPFRLDADGLLARVIQHEYDHLRGALFIDYLGEHKRERLLRLYRRQQRA